MLFNPVNGSGPRESQFCALQLLINSLERFPVGSMKHAVMCNEAGLIAAHGIIEPKAEAHFESFAGGPPGTSPPANVPFRRDGQHLRLPRPRPVSASGEARIWRPRSLAAQDASLGPISACATQTPPGNFRRSA